MNFPNSIGANPAGFPMQQLDPTAMANRTYTGFEIVRFLITETGTYNNMVIRPFHVDIRADTVNQILELSSDTTNVGSTVMAPIANQIMRPAPVAEAVATISNGWATPRCRYILEVRYNIGGITSHEVINGYTDHLGLANNNAIDPQMRFFVNNITTVSQTTQLTAQGNILVPRIVGSTQVMTNPNWTHGSNLLNTETPTVMRPIDVFTVMKMSGISDSDSVVVADAKLKAAPVYSKRANNVASSYLANTISAYSTAASPMMGSGFTDEGILEQARGMVMESTTTSSGFMNKLRSLQNSGVAAFTFRDLAALDSYAANKVKVIRPKPAERMNLHQVGQTAAWNDATAETMAANVLSQAIPALMMEYGLARVDFVSTNNTAGAQPETSVLNARSFADHQQGPGLQHAAESFKRRLMVETIRDLTYNNQIQYYIEASFDLNGDSKCRIALNSNSIYDYVLPTYSDALISPVVTSQNGRLFDTASQLHTLITNVTYEANQHMQHVPTMPAGFPNAPAPTAPMTGVAGIQS